MAAKILDGKTLAATLREQVAVEASAWQTETGIQPNLVTVLVGEDPASAVYIRNKHTACQKAGFRAGHHALPATTSETELLGLIETLNHDAEVHGILIQLPLPAQINAQRVLDSIAPHKDVDAFHPENVGLIVQGRPRFLPCTPAGVLQVLAHAQIAVAGAHAVVLGRSEIVGKPLGLMLLQNQAGANATVTICHSRTRNLPEITRTADILIAAIGRANFVTADMVKPGAVVIDVGINRVGDKLCGDVDFQAVSQVASAITPVPGGIGPMTIAMLLRNTLTAAQASHAARI